MILVSSMAILKEVRKPPHLRQCFSYSSLALFFFYRLLCRPHLHCPMILLQPLTWGSELCPNSVVFADRNSTLETPTNPELLNPSSPKPENPGNPQALNPKPYISLYTPTYPYISLHIPTYPYISLHISIYPYISLYVPIRVTGKVWSTEPRWLGL